MGARTLSLVLLASLGACVWDWSIPANPDAGLDAGGDGGIDAGVDAGVDGGGDAGLDAGHDAGTDAGIDAGFDGGSDAGLDAGLDAGPGLPTAVLDAGYSMNTFHSGPFDATNVDLGDTGATGFQWYLNQPFGGSDTPASAVHLDPDAGSVTLVGGSLDSFNMKSLGSGGFGGGAYFEAVLAFDPTCGTPGAFPIWWSQALEHFEYLGAKDLWQGQSTGYAHFIGIDFMSDDAFNSGQFGGILHDWAGVYNGSAYPFDITNAQGGGSNYANALIQLAGATALTQPHRYGFLWIPATPSTPGQAGFYFDGVATTDQVGWTQYDCTASPAPPPGTAPWTFGILDCDHPAMVLSGPASCPLTVYSVDVWQANATKNLVQ